MHSRWPPWPRRAADARPGGPGHGARARLGHIWLDESTFELRYVEFQYTHLPRSTDYERIKGEIHFAHLSNGTWIVRRWFTRVPQSVAYAVGQVGAYHLPDTIYTQGVAFLVEDGGDVTAQDFEIFEEAASLSGVVRDSAGKPLDGGRVLLSGTQFETLSDSAGRFRFDSLPPGLYTVRVTTPGYDSLGVAVGSEDVTLQASKTHAITFRAPRTATLATRLCGGRKPARGRSTLLLTLVDSASSAPLDQVPLRFSWTEYGSRVHGVPQTVQGSTAGRTNARGQIVFCGLPPGAQLDLAIPVDDTHAIAVRSLQGDDMLRADAVRAMVIRIRKPW